VNSLTITSHVQHCACAFWTGRAEPDSDRRKTAAVNLTALRKQENFMPAILSDFPPMFLLLFLTESAR
jgi:hypothetical protein